MSILLLIYLLPVLWNSILVSSSILTPLNRDGSLRLIEKSPDEFTYILKRHVAESRSADPESKERRSGMGSSFIRFGRSEREGNMEHSDLGTELDTVRGNRSPRWKSPDIVIRFGRSRSKFMDKNERADDVNLMRFGREAQQDDMVDIDTLCSPVIRDLYKYTALLNILKQSSYNLCRTYDPCINQLEESPDCSKAYAKQLQPPSNR